MSFEPTSAKELEAQSTAPTLVHSDPEHPLALLSQTRKNVLLLIFSISGFVDGKLLRFSLHGARLTCPSKSATSAGSRSQ